MQTPATNTHRQTPGLLTIFLTLLGILFLTGCGKKIEYEGFQDGVRYIVKINSDYTQVTTTIIKAGGEPLTRTGKMYKGMESQYHTTYRCFLEGEKPQESDKEVDYEIYYDKQTDSYKLQNLTYTSFDLIPTGGAKQKPNSKKEWEATKRNIVGLYHSEKGMGGWGGTCELLYGGGYFLKDQMLQNGQMIGEYSLSGNEITFYQDGSVVFKAEVSETELNIGPGKASYIKK